MMKRSSKQHMDGLLAVLLLAVFAACLVLVLLTGAQVYQRLSQRDDAAYTWRTAGQYVSAKVRQEDRIDAVSVEEFDGRAALVLQENIDDEVYFTRIYCCDGYLRELFSPSDVELAAEDGEKVLPMHDFSVMLDEDMLTFVLEDEAGRKQTILLALRSGEGAGA